MSAQGEVAPASNWEGRLLRWRSSDLFILTTVCIATFTDGFVYSVIVPVLPYVLEDYYHVPPGQGLLGAYWTRPGSWLTLSVQFWTSALLAIFGGIILVGSPFLGIVADHTRSRKPPLYFGFISLLVAVIILAVGDDVKWLIVSRVLQGLSAAGMLERRLPTFPSSHLRC
jgi:MFS family permease